MNMPNFILFFDMLQSYLSWIQNGLICLPTQSGLNFIVFWMSAVGTDGGSKLQGFDQDFKNGKNVRLKILLLLQILLKSPKNLHRSSSNDSSQDEWSRFLKFCLIWIFWTILHRKKANFSNNAKKWLQMTP